MALTLARCFLLRMTAHNQPRTPTLGNERGVTAIEMALVCLAFLGIIGFLLDVGIALFHYSLLMNATASTARTIAAYDAVQYGLNPGGSADSAWLATRAEDLAEEYLEETFGIPSSEFSPDDPVISFTGGLVNGEKKCFVSLHSEWRIRCFFCLFLGRFRVRAQSEAMIEDPCFASSMCGI